MKAREFDPRRLNVEAWSRDGQPLQGLAPLSQLSRLAESLAAGVQDDLQWQAEVWRRESAAGGARIEMRLQVQAAVPLTCQRCLQPLQQPLPVDRRFRFARDEAEALRLDDETEDEVLALERHLDLLALIEDELILALPLVPRHEACPLPGVEAPAAADEIDEAGSAEAPHPFAALADWKVRRS